MTNMPVATETTTTDDASYGTYVSNVNVVSDISTRYSLGLRKFIKLR